MSVKEVYIKKVEDELKRFNFELEELKKHVDKTGIGDSTKWIKEYHSLRDRSDAISYHLRLFKQPKNIILGSIAKAHIDQLKKQWEIDFYRLAYEYGYRPLTNDL